MTITTNKKETGYEGRTINLENLPRVLWQAQRRLGSVDALAERLGVNATSVNLWKERQAIPGSVAIKRIATNLEAAIVIKPEGKPAFDREEKTVNSENLTAMIKGLATEHTQATVAKRLGVAPQSVDQWRNAGSALAGESLFAIADAVGVEIIFTP